jgi:hypothetical protein
MHNRRRLWPGVETAIESGDWHSILGILEDIHRACDHVQPRPEKVSNILISCIRNAQHGTRKAIDAAIVYCFASCIPRDHRFTGVLEQVLMHVQIARCMMYVLLVVGCVGVTYQLVHLIAV